MMWIQVLPQVGSVYYQENFEIVNMIICCLLGVLAPILVLYKKGIFCPYLQKI